MIYRLYVTTYAIDQDPEDCVFTEIRTFPDKAKARKAFYHAIDEHAPTHPDGKPYEDTIIKSWFENGNLIEGWFFFSWDAKVTGTLSLVELPGDMP